MKHISFFRIATSLAEELYGDDPNLDTDTVEKRMRRRFVSFIEAIGGDALALKNEKNQMMFDEDDAPTIKVILTQLEKKDGVAYEISKRKEATGSISEAHGLIQMLLDGLSSDGMTDAEAQAAVNCLDRLFQFSFRMTIENCHRLVEGVAMNLMPMPYTHSMMYVRDFYTTLQKAFAITTVNATMMLGELGEIIRMGKELAETDDPSDLYGDEEDDIKAEYRQRDANAVAFLEANPEIRRYVEKVMGATVQEVWGIKDLADGNAGQTQTAEGGIEDE